MRKGVLGVLALVFLAGVVWAEGPGKNAGGSSSVVLRGTLIDVLCVQEHKRDLAGYARTHTRDCALRSAGVASGYALLTPDGEVLKFTKASSTKIVKFLKGPESSLAVEVTVKAGYKRKMNLLSIKRQG